MNQAREAVGWACPDCGHDVAEVLDGLGTTQMVLSCRACGREFAVEP